MTTAKVGDMLQDCDPRSTHRRGKVVEVYPNGYRVDWGTGHTTVLAHRVHTKGIRSGYRLLPPDPEEPQSRAPASPSADELAEALEGPLRAREIEIAEALAAAMPVDPRTMLADPYHWRAVLAHALADYRLELARAILARRRSP